MIAPSPKECPQCGLWSSQSAKWCDCGYAFGPLTDDEIAGLKAIRAFSEPAGADRLSRLALNSVRLLTFCAAWMYCTAKYGFLFGFGFGWLPAGILAAIMGFAWTTSTLLFFVLAAVVVAIAAN